MHLEKVLRYPAPPAAVAALLADAAFVADVCEASGAETWDAEVEGDASGEFTVTSARTLPSTELPDSARRLIGQHVRVREVDHWEAPAADGSRRGTLTLQVLGAPVTGSAEQHLVPEPDGTTRHTLVGELRANVPLLGSRIEKAASGPLMAALEELEEIAGARLRG